MYFLNEHFLCFIIETLIKKKKERTKTCVGARFAVRDEKYAKKYHIGIRLLYIRISEMGCDILQYWCTCTKEQK